MQERKNRGDMISLANPKKIPYVLITQANMMFPKKKQNSFQLSFKEKEVPLYLPMEAFLMEDLGICTRSDTYKITLKHLYQQRKQVRMEMA